jgi:hypothetical protein
MKHSDTFDTIFKIRRPDSVLPMIHINKDAIAISACTRFGTNHIDAPETFNVIYFWH